MLMNATHTEEIRVAVVDNGKLIDLDVEPIGKDPEKSNIYKGIITRVEPGLEAAFVNYGAERHGFLPFREIAREYFATDNVQSRPNIKSEIYEGQEIIIQVEKEQRGNKGAALTTFHSLAGIYTVLQPNKKKPGVGISKRIDGEDRNDSKESISKLNIREDMGVILRTAGLGRSQEELQWDLDILVGQWDAIQNAASSKKAPFLIHKESNVVIRAIRDHLRPDIEEILIDNLQVFEDTCAHIKIVRPDFVDKIKFYDDSSTTLFNKFEIDKQIESAFQREVRLPSGGAIVIDHTEALISIDVNSAKSTRGANIENTAFQTNLEASEEIARQLRLRDLGGLIVIDYIDMSILKHQRAVETKLHDAATLDRARVQIGKISRFGLLEMSRQRLRPALSESREIPCPRCNGQGTIHSIEALSFIILRVLENEAMNEDTCAIKANLPVELATFLINEKRSGIAAIEERQNVTIYILPNPNLVTPEYKLETISTNNKTGELDNIPSYKMAHKSENKQNNTKAHKNFTPSKHHSEPAVTISKTQAPAPHNKNAPSIIKRLWSSIIGSDSDTSNRTTTNDATISPPIVVTPKHEHSRRPRNNNRPMHNNKIPVHKNQSSKQHNLQAKHNANKVLLPPILTSTPIVEVQQKPVKVSASTIEPPQLKITHQLPAGNNTDPDKHKKNSRQEHFTRKRSQKPTDSMAPKTFSQESPAPITWETRNTVDDQPPINVVIEREYHSEK